MGSGGSKKTAVNAFKIDLDRLRDSNSDIYSTRSDDVTNNSSGDDVMATDRSVSELKLRLERLRALERLNRKSQTMERSWSEEVRRRLQVNKRKQREEEERKSIREVRLWKKTVCFKNTYCSR